MIQLIQKDEFGWRLLFDNTPLFFSVKPIALYMNNNLIPLTPECKNGLRWRIKNKWISYKQIKQVINL